MSDSGREAGNAIGERPYVTDAERWEAIQARDAAADGCFVYGVATTGIYCRPGCPSRRPKRENARFFETWREAEAAGFRPCKRCKPRGPDRVDPAVEAVTRACRMIDEAEQPPSLQELGDAVGLSRYHLQRTFRRIVGVTPKQYANERRLDRMRALLREGMSVTEAIYGAGFESSSRFYEGSTAALGMRPSQYRKGGEGVTMRYATTRCDLGWVLVAATERGICWIGFDDSAEPLGERLAEAFPRAERLPGDPTLGEMVAEVVRFIERPERGLSLPLDIQGTAFQRRVWAALQDIPVGSTETYGQVAARIGKPTAARAVARACATNKIAVAIPCHRVVQSDGGLGGYRWGIERKRALLDHERGASDGEQ